MRSKPTASFTEIFTSSCSCWQIINILYIIIYYSSTIYLQLTQWGGSLCSDVQDELTNVKQLVATDAAFAALKTNGSVVTFGDENSGADSNSRHAWTSVFHVFLFFVVCCEVFFVVFKRYPAMIFGSLVLDDSNTQNGSFAGKINR